MQRPRASALPVFSLGAALALAASLAGCASSRLSAEAPPGVRLAGDWKLDTARSDDLGKAVQQLRQQSEEARRNALAKQSREESEESEGPERGHGAPGEPGGQESGEAGESESSPGPEIGAGGLGAGPRLSPVDELMSNVPQGDYLRIGVSASAFTVRSGDSSSQYTPGLESEVSAEHGDAQQISGWKDGGYVIETKPQWGPEIIQRYGLTQDGRLNMTLRLSGSGIDFTFTRIYDRTTRLTPLAPPTLN